MIDIYTEKKESKDWILRNDLYFNLNTGNEEMSENEINLKVVFGKILGERKSSLEFHLDSDEIKNCFPYKIRVFKTGNVLVQNNSWQLFDEKWVKCQPL